MAARTDTRASASDPEEPPDHGGGAETGIGADARKPFLLRLPPPLMADLRSWAAQEVRSLNGQIEYLLREAVQARRKNAPRP